MPSTEDVRAYLKANPGFLRDNLDILAELDIPARDLGNDIIDLQTSMNQRLRRDLDKVRRLQATFMANSEANLSLIERFHATAFAAVDADSLHELVTVIEQTLPPYLEVDAACLLVEAADVPASWLDQGLRPVSPGKSALWMGSEDILLRPAALDRVEIHGPKASVVMSDALIRLPMPEEYPTIMLAIGVGRLDHFHPDQGTEFIAFLSAIIARCLLRWTQP